MAVYEIVLRRRTIRRFKQKPIPYEILEKLVNAGRLAPSGANLQPCEFIIVDKKDFVEKLFPALNWAGYIRPRGNPKEGERPVAYIVVLLNKDKRPEGGQDDAAAAIENILLVACEEGLGSAWLGSIDKKAIREILEIPENCSVEYVVALGYPKEKPVVEEFVDSVKYWKDEKGVLHVPKRTLSMIVHRNIYGRGRD